MRIHCGVQISLHRAQYMRTANGARVAYSHGVVPFEGCSTGDSPDIERRVGRAYARAQLTVGARLEHSNEGFCHTEGVGASGSQEAVI